MRCTEMKVIVIFHCRSRTVSIKCDASIVEARQSLLNGYIAPIANFAACLVDGKVEIVSKIETCV